MYKYKLDNKAFADKNINVFKADGPCDIHTHEFVELVYVISGECTQYVDGKAYNTSAGDMLLINYGQTHSIDDGTPSARYYNIEYIPEFFGNALMNSEDLYDIFEYLLLGIDTEQKMLPTERVTFTASEQPLISSMLEEMYRELSAKSVGYRNILEGYSKVLLSKIMRKALKQRMPDGDSTARIVEKCIDYINKNYFCKLTLSELAKDVSYNPSYLSRIFKKYCGINMWDYIKRVRLEEAASLLAQTEATVECVMTKVGYSDKKQFYKDFADAFGTTPAAYRNK